MRTIYEKQIHVAELLQKPSVLSLRYRKYFDKTIACFRNYLNYWGIWTIPDCNFVTDHARALWTVEVAKTHRSRNIWICFNFEFLSFFSPDIGYSVNLQRQARWLFKWWTTMNTTSMLMTLYYVWLLQFYCTMQVNFKS